MTSTKYLILVVCCLAFSKCLELPQDVKKCKLSSDAQTLNKCLLDAVNLVTAKLEKGFPELGVEPAQPLKLNSFSVGEGSGVVHVVQNYYDAVLHNVVHIKAQSVSAVITPKEIKMQMESFANNLKLAGQYNVNGSLLIFPVYGTGDVEINLNDVKIQTTLNGVTYENKGETYLKFKETKLRIMPKKIVYNFKNLFNGNKALGDNINKVLNENDLEIYKDVKKGYEETISNVIKNLVNSVVGKIPFKSLILP